MQSFGVFYVERWNFTLTCDVELHECTTLFDIPLPSIYCTSSLQRFSKRLNCHICHLISSVSTLSDLLLRNVQYSRFDRYNTPRKEATNKCVLETSLKNILTKRTRNKCQMFIHIRFDSRYSSHA